jgi:hypothetical protein
MMNDETPEHSDEPSVSYKMFGNSWVGAQLVAFQEGISCSGGFLL